MSKTIIDNISIFNTDCMEYMSNIPDNTFDLAVVDPPYGINIGEKAKSFSAKKFMNGVNWDYNIPDKKYFNELFRVSTNQIIWGANYFLDHLKATKCMIVWNKYNTNKGRFADGEIAWTSFSSPTRIVTYEWLMWYQPDMKNKQERIHPTQKPIQLYHWILKTYAMPGMKIFDSHMGSGSLAIACMDYDYQFFGCEINGEYFNGAKKRIINHASQLKIGYS